MPKQIGSRQIRGKFGQECYYFRKGMQTGLYRGINQQMSERVKRDPNFANTRLYASEFGYCGRLAALSFVPSEFDMTINLRDNSQGQLTKIYRQLLNEHGIGAFGKRVMSGLGWQDQFVQRINKQCRLNTDQTYPITHSVKFFRRAQANRYDINWHMEWDERLVSAMERYGLESINLTLSFFDMSAGLYDTASGAYVGISRLVSGFTIIYPLTISEVRSANSVTRTLNGAYIYHPQDDAGVANTDPSRLCRPILSMEGYRKVGNQLYKQQTLCGFKLLDNAEVIDNRISHIEFNGVEYREGDNGPTLDMDTSDEVLIYGDYIGTFPSKDGFSVRLNNTNSFVFLHTGNMLNISIPGSIDRARLHTVGVTYPDGSTTTLRLN